MKIKIFSKITKIKKYKSNNSKKICIISKNFIKKLLEFNCT
jgi:hypothetical protein